MSGTRLEGVRVGLGGAFDLLAGVSVETEGFLRFFEGLGGRGGLLDFGGLALLAGQKAGGEEGRDGLAVG